MSCTAAHQLKTEHHTLCFKCYRAERDRRRATMLAEVKPAMLRAPFQKMLNAHEVAHRRRMLDFAQSQENRAARR